MKVGDTLMELRLNKGKSISEVCKKDINRGNYWRIETNKVIPRVDTLKMILDNLNVSLLDFLEIYYEENTEDETLMRNLKKSFERRNLAGVATIIDLAEEKYNSTNKDYYKHIYHVATIFHNRIDNIPYSIDSITVLKNYLFSCEKWTYYEIRILNNTLFLYDDESMIIFYKRALQFLEKTNRNKYYDELKIKISENIIMHFLYKENYRLAEKVYKIMKNLNISEYQSSARILKLWIEGIVECVIYKNKNSIKKIDNALEIYKTLGMEGQYKLHKSWTDLLIKKEIFH